VFELARRSFRRTQKLFSSGLLRLSLSRSVVDFQSVVIATMTSKESRPLRINTLNDIMSNSLQSGRSSAASQPFQEYDAAMNSHDPNLRLRISSPSFDDSLESALCLPYRVSSTENWHNPLMTRNPRQSGLQQRPSRSERMQFLSQVLEEAIQINQDFLSSEEMHSHGSSRIPSAQ
jgi:hypothetical protein